MSDWQVRAATVADYPRLVEIFNQVTHPSTVEDFVRLDEQRAASGLNLRVLLADEAGAVHAFGGLTVDAWRSEGTYMLQVVVDPAAAGQGLGAQLHGYLEAEARRLGARLAVSNVRDDRPEWLAWAERRGYRVTNQYFKSELDLRSYDPAPFRPAVDRARAAGYRFFTLADVEEEAGKRRLYAVDMEAAIDEPGIETTKWPPITYPEYCAQMFQPPLYDPRAVVVAARGDDWAGFTGLHFRPQSGSAWVSFTGVLRPHRGQGLAQALKVLSAEYALAQGWTKIGTSNNARNPAMLAVNRKLGFVQMPGMYVVEKGLAVDS